MRRHLLWGHDETVLNFVAQLAPVERPLWRDIWGAVGVLRADGRMVGGVVFSEYKPQFGTMELSAAGVSCYLFDTRMVRELGAYAFGQLNTYRIFARTSDRNRRAKDLLENLGFRHEGVKAHLYGEGKHASDWRVIRPEWERRWGAIELPKAA